jgi:hypothetical protein
MQLRKGFRVGRIRRTLGLWVWDQPPGAFRTWRVRIVPRTAPNADSVPVDVTKPLSAPPPTCGDSLQTPEGECFIVSVTDITDWRSQCAD